MSKSPTLTGLVLSQAQAGRSPRFIEGYRAGLRWDADDDRLAQLVVTALEDGYTSGVEALLSYAMDGETIYGRFRDGAQTCGYTLKDNEISYWLLDGTERTDSLVQRPIWRVDRAAPKKGNKCTKGIKCGLSCINSRRTCRIEPSAQAKQAISEAKKEIGSKSTSKPKKASKPKAAEKPAPNPKVEEQSGFTVQTSEGTTKRDRKKIERELKTVQKEGKKLYESDPDYKDNYSIWVDIGIEMGLTPEGFRGIRDQSGNLQAAAMVRNRDKSVHLEYLATSPHNVKGSDPRRVRGAGTKAMEAVVLEAVKGGKGVTLDALPGAVPFYEKIGFSNNGQAIGYSKGVRAMDLSADAAKSWLDSRGIKYDSEASLEDLEDQALGAFAVGSRQRKLKTKKDGHLAIMQQRRIRP